MRDANPGVPSDVREHMAKDSFLDALNDRELELSVFQSQPKNLQDALRIALEIEAFYKSRDRRVPLRTIKQDIDCQPNKNLDLVESLEKRIAKLEVELRTVQVSKVEKDEGASMHGKTTQRSHKSKVVCFYCDKPGHVVKNCRKKESDKQKNDISLNQPQLE